MITDYLIACCLSVPILWAFARIGEHWLMPWWLALPINIVLWFIYNAFLWFPLFLVGLIAVPLAIELGGTEDAPIPHMDETTGQRVSPWWIYNAPRWLWLWGNDEDGYQSPTVMRLTRKKWSLWYTMFNWAALRNSVGNLRFIKSIHPPQRADRVQWKTFGKHTFVWQGVLGVFIYNTANWQTNTPLWAWIGWKYEPEKRDAMGWKEYGQGFATRIVRK